MKLSIIICVRNEKETILDAIHQTHAVDLGEGWDKEIIVVDNFSTDGTRERLNTVDLPDVRVILHPRDMGKSGSLQTGIREASGDYFVIFDADLEYEAADLPRLVERIVPGETAAVYGSRTLGGRKVYEYAQNYWGVRLLTWATNLLYGCHLTDVAVGLKLARLDLARSMTLSGAGFDWEFELTCKLLKHGYDIPEVPIAYHPRTAAQGKGLVGMMAVKTGVRWLWIVVKTRIFG
jgi:glycosyltransferase involved in cell wall biosynthesis